MWVSGLGMALVVGVLWGTRPAAGPPDEPAVAEGSAGCAGCHAEAVAAWQGSQHALAQRGPEALDGPPPEVDGQALAVRGVLGVTPLVQYLVDAPTVPGALQVAPEALDPRDGTWFRPFPGARPGTWGHWTGGGMTWNRSCASCHTTDFRKGFDGTGYTSTWAEAGVGCASCHGGLEGHPAEGTRPTTTHGTEGCAPCHARRAELTDGYVVGAPFLDHFLPQAIDGVHFHADGQAREEVFEWGGFVASRMHAVGVRCVDCHDPHDGTTRREGDPLCRGCHDGLGTAPHDLHAAPLACVDCHMPEGVFMGRDRRRDHRFLLPDPVSADRLGLPDACLGCHDRDDVRAAYASTYRGGHRASAGDRLSGDPERLAAQLRQGPPASRAAAAAFATPWAPHPAVRQALLEALEAEAGTVRLAAVAALSGLPDPSVQQALAQRLDDPLRAVRVAAARAVPQAVVPGSAAADDLARWLAHDADQPEGQRAAAHLALARRAPDQAVAHLEAAVALDPGHAPSWDDLAVLRASGGDAAGAEVAAARAAAAAPDDPELAFRHGLALVGVGQPAEAIERFAALPGHARAQLQRGLLLVQGGDPAGGLRVLFEAEALAPDDADIRYAIAWALARWGRPEEARIAAKRVLQVAPDHAGARAIVGAR